MGIEVRDCFFKIGCIILRNFNESINQGYPNGFIHLSLPKIREKDLQLLVIGAWLLVVNLAGWQYIVNLYRLRVDNILSTYNLYRLTKNCQPARLTTRSQAPICQNRKQKNRLFSRKKSSRWQEENNRLLFSLTGREYQGLKYFWERWAEQYIPRRTHKILDPIGPTPHKYLFVETEFSWCLKLCYYILTTYIHIRCINDGFSIVPC